MSKRVLILLAAGFLMIIAGVFLLKHELSRDNDSDNYDQYNESDDKEDAEVTEVLKGKEDDTDKGPEKTE